MVLCPASPQFNRWALKIGRKYMKLYWVTTEDHDEDWFIVASSPQEATQYYENMEGYDPGDAKAEEILDIPENVPVEKRLILQKLIRDIKVNNIMKHYQSEIPNMIDDIDKLYEDCRLKAVAFNNIAEKIKKRMRISRR
jgi:hypothetical protein